MIGQTEVQGWVKDLLAEKISEEFDSLATFENAIYKQCLGVQGAVLEQVTPEAADKIALICPTCANPLRIVDRRRERTVDSMFGPIRISRAYGYCAQ